MEVKFNSATLCEEVRREASGKSILIGAAPFGPSVGEGENVKAERFGIYLEAFVSGVELLVIRLISEDNKVEVFRESFKIQKPPSDFVADTKKETEVVAGLVIALNKSNSELGKAGLFKLQWSVDDDKWGDIRDVIFPVGEASMTSD